MTEPAPRRGLSEAEAAARLRRDGPNEAPTTQGSSVLHALAALLREPLFLLLFTAAALYAWLGERGDAIALVASAVAAAAITVAQQYRTERVLLALRSLSSPRALVLRDGTLRRVPSRELVVGDVVVVAEGDRLAADARLVRAHNLRVDESLLTGEAVPVDKFAPDGTTPAAPRSVLYANTLVLAGRGEAVVTAVATRTEVGRIGEALHGLDDAVTPLQRDTRQLARLFGALGLGLSLLLALGHGVIDGRWSEGVLRALTLAMAVLPEEFPLVITVFLALGARRLTAAQVLTRRTGAIEALGAATLLAVDKTGTLTRNRMRLARIATADASITAVDGAVAPGEAARDLARTAALASEPEPADPMDQACRAWAGTSVQLPPAARLRRRYAMASERLVVGHAWSLDDGWTLAAKGAPEHVLAVCTLEPGARERVVEAARRLAADGLRVLGVAAAHHDGEQAPAELVDVAWRFVGLLAFEDPLRPEVPTAVRDCRRAGIRLLMITGDHPATAAAIARAAGIADEPRVVEGAELAACSDSALDERLPSLHAVARATPLLKLRLVQALQRNGHVVAMTGDGVNDAPALRAAHIGVAMGQRGSDVAREAASLVLLNDDFGSLVAAIRQGRRIFANLRQALLYVLAVHVPLVGASLLPLLVGAPPLLLPLHVMFLEFVIDPACSLAFEAEPDGGDPMAQPPRPVHEHVLGRRQFAQAALQGLLALGGSVGAFAACVAAGAGEAATRAVVVTSIVLLNVALILHNRAAAVAAPNGVLWSVVGATLAAWGTVLAVPALRDVFRIALPSAPVAAAMLGCIAVAVALLRTTAGRRLDPAQTPVRTAS
ncbi:cation-translocating P-type ATPase [Aquabacterium sp. J223]|uniref:cation-translocating P-type ATPase n=1 Tax=Aquabacterium sp. J223 TaxID=2898431 RepID=UPI0021ADE3A3|nr:cation-translocating P-type ATPase [Aquabacterium sp. J223]UUX95020.1 cation-translocating P-type ATPase [Aquabacterium sp. J223]